MFEEPQSRPLYIAGLKAELLCKGVYPNDVAKAMYQRQNPYGDWKTGNVGIHISIDGASSALVTISHQFDRKSPYSLEAIESGLALLKNGLVVCRVEEVSTGNWCHKKTSTGIAMGNFFLHEGKKFLHQAYTGCDYYAGGKQCKFCGTGAKWEIASPTEVAQIVSEALRGNSAYHVCLGGGTRMPLSRNVDYFCECASVIRENNPEVPIWVEMVPPESDDDILRLVRAGVSSFGFNIEIWNDELRKGICPGKSEIPKTTYLRACQKVVDTLGPNRVGSCLLVGLEPIKDSIECVRALADVGSQPCILPFKPWDKSAFRYRPPCRPQDLIEASEAAVDAMIENGICPDRNQGCLLCEGCTIDHDLYKIKVNQIYRGKKK